jgi:UDP-N-acetylmuramate: L-alanyl-gamma-D-glutamyl-meso-diaminopimelate ligase
MHVYFVGIADVGMSALAALFVEAGHQVSGSDAAFDPPIGPTLRALGVRCVDGYDPAHLDPSPDLVVVGDAIHRSNPEAQQVERRRLPRESMSGALRSHFLARRRPLIVAGTYGKTTTSSLCAWLLSRAGFEPGWFIGGSPKGLPGAAAIGSIRAHPLRSEPTPFVVEGDAHDSVYWQKTPKFLDYAGIGSEDVVIVNKVGQDRDDIYPDAESYEAALAAFLRKVPERGFVVCDASDARARALVAREARARVVYCALEGEDTGEVTPTWVGALRRVTDAGAQTFDLFAAGMSCGVYRLHLARGHNVRNAVAALAACGMGFGLDVTDAHRHIASFPGVRSRQDLLGEPAGVRVYADFGRHPTSVDEATRALRALNPDGTLWIAFEPPTTTAFSALRLDAYARAFDAADRVLLAPLGRTNFPEGGCLDVERLARGLGAKAAAMASVDAIVERLVAEAESGDAIGLLSSGALGGIHARLLAELEARGPRGDRRPLI